MQRSHIIVDKRILVTGACGTVGRELVKQLVSDHRIKELIAIDNQESNLFFLEQEFSEYGNVHFYLADVRDKDKISRKMKNIDIVFHTAAYKHVILCERAPFEAVQTNILGVQNIINGAIENNVGRVIFTSSDKAVNPTSVMGTSKLMGERLITAASVNSPKGSRRCFLSTRFGNVLGSRGSVIPIFREQIRKGGPVTVTHERMTRFIMSLKQAVRLIIESVALASGGEVFITKMPAIRIMDLAEVMIEELSAGFGHSPGDIEIIHIGTKPGEKMYEELMSLEETRRASELEQYYVVHPALSDDSRSNLKTRSGLIRDKITQPYHSGNEPPLTKARLSGFLKQNDLLTDRQQQSHPDQRHWPDFNRQSP